MAVADLGRFVGAQQAKKGIALAGEASETTRSKRAA
jgi:hypothetical protein